MNLTEIFAILIIHWFADFVLQTDKQAKGKSKNWDDLLGHTFTYTYIFAIVGALYSWYSMFSVHGIIENISLFLLITFVAHTITDYYTSRLNSKLWASGNSHNFFISVGFDQVLHYVQLFTTYWILFK